MSFAMPKRSPVVIVFLTGVLMGLPCWGAEIFTYVDQNGKQVFTNISSNPNFPAEAQTLSNRKPLSGLKGRTVPTAGALPYSKDLAAKIDALVRKYDLNRFNLGPEFIHAVIQVESDYDPYAISNKGARGLMQLMPATAKRFGVKNAFSPEENLEGGIQYLRFLLETFKGDVNLALAAYNAGENVVQRLKTIPPYRETRDYVRKVSQILGNSRPIPLYNASTHGVTYVAWVDGKLKFTNVDPPASAVVFDGYHLPRHTSTP